MRIGNASRRFHRLLPCAAVGRRLGGIHAKCNVVVESVVEENRLLIDIAHERTQVVGANLTDVGAVDGYRALRRVVESGQHIGKCRFSTTRLPH